VPGSVAAAIPKTERPLTVCLDARLVSGDRGGVEQVIIGLADAFSRLDDGDERYLFLVDPGHSAWLEPHVFGPSSLLTSGGRPALGDDRGGLRRTAGRAVKTAIPRPIRAAIHNHRRVAIVLSDSDGAIEEAGVDVVHFPMQVGFQTAVPTVFAPHDLQHLHFPEFFTKRHVAERESTYRALCERASVVTVMSTYGRDDLMARYGLAPDKILVVPGAATIAANAPLSATEVAETRERLRLPVDFALYPAKAWPHKNHVRLVAALRVLRDQGIDIPLVLTGSQSGREIPVMAEAATRGVDDLIHFVGFVTPQELTALYRMARIMVFPSLFEGWGLPILEAMTADLPLACSTATCLPAITAGAAELFDPTDIGAIAHATSLVWQDENLRKRLIADGRLRASQFSWDRSARMFRACYRKLGNRCLSADDSTLLDAPPLA
jgi:glycosyltransferase involved in cell wall biosynthesis